MGQGRLFRRGLRMSAVTVSRPVVQSRPNLRVTTRSRSKVIGAVVARCAVFAVVALATSAASSLTGNVMVEKARRDGIHAAERSRDARAAEAVLRRKVNELTSIASIQEWAIAHGFEAPDVLSPTSTRKNLVALNH
jgi:hypothetical protein